MYLSSTGIIWFQSLLLIIVVAYETRGKVLEFFLCLLPNISPKCMSQNDRTQQPTRITYTYPGASEQWQMGKQFKGFAKSYIICVYVYVHVYVHEYVHMYMYTHTHLHLFFTIL